MKTQDQLFKEMTPDLQALYEKFYIAMHAAGLDFEVNEVLRTTSVQAAYYAQGREELEEVNRIRKNAGLSAIPAKENNYKVTWTLNSRHFPGPDGLARAFDIRLLKNSRPHWETKWDGNQNNVADYKEAALIGISLGLDAGGLWKNPDFPHYQLK